MLSGELPASSDAFSSSSQWEMVEKCWEYKPRLRPSMVQCLQRTAYLAPADSPPISPLSHVQAVGPSTPLPRPLVHWRADPPAALCPPEVPYQSLFRLLPLPVADVLYRLLGIRREYEQKCEPEPQLEPERHRFPGRRRLRRGLLVSRLPKSFIQRLISPF